MLRKFYRSNLPNVVWNPETSSPLAEFRGGQFTTEDESVAEVLIEKGYPEVDLKAKTPPPIPDAPLQSAEQVNVPVLGKQVTEETLLSKQKREALMKKEAEGSESSDEGDTAKRVIKRRGKE